MSSGVRRMIFGGVALAFSGIVSLVALELAVRVVLPQPPSWLGIYRHHPSLPIHALQPEQQALVATGETRWEVRTDADGRRVPVEAAPSAARCRSTWVGDSFAFGHGVDYEESWIGLLAAAVPERAQVNAAVPGYGPRHYAMITEGLADELAAGEPLYVASYLGNDFHDVAWEREVVVHEGILGHEGDLKSWVKTRFHLYRLLSGVRQSLRSDRANPYVAVLQELAEPAAWSRDPLQDAEPEVIAAFERIRSVADVRGAALRVVLLPTRDAVLGARGEETIGAQPGLPAQRLGAALAERGIAVLDATPLFATRPVDEVFFPLDGHLTPAGNRLLADALLERWPLACR